MLHSSARSLMRSAVASARPSAPHHSRTLKKNLSSGPQSESGGGGGGKAVILASAGVAGILGGTLGLAWFDKDFRKTVEDSVPGSSSVLNAVLGEPEPEKPPPTPVKKAPPKLPVTSAPPSKMRARTETAIVANEKTKSDSEPTRKEETNETNAKKDSGLLLPPPPIDSPPSAKSSTSTKEPTTEQRQEQESSEKSLDKKEASIVKDEKKSYASPVKDEDSTSIAHEHKLLSTDDIADLQGSLLSQDSTSLSSEQLERELHKRVSNIKMQLEEQMVKQLKLQAEAHLDHLNDSLEVQRKELTRKYIRELDDTLEKAQLGHQNSLTALSSHVKGLEDALKNRSEMDAASLEAQELWLACTALMNAVSSNSGDQLRSIAPEIAAVRRAVASQSDEFVENVLAALPPEGINSGIHTESSIRERFIKVERLARQTALVGDEGGSLLRYFLSYLQSLLIISPVTFDTLPSKTSSIDLDSLTTYDIVWLAKGCLDRGDLEQAVRYMTLLRGEPRNVAQDWLKDARVLLETRLACSALMAHAVAVGVEALPQRQK